jgi:hypothetical protein
LWWRARWNIELLSGEKNNGHKEEKREKDEMKKKKKAKTKREMIGRGHSSVPFLHIIIK